MFAVHEVHDFCLCPSGAMYHSMYFVAHTVEYSLDYRSIGACRRKNELACAHRTAFDRIEQRCSAAVYKFYRQTGIVAFRIFLGEVFIEYVVPG